MLVTEANHGSLTRLLQGLCRDIYTRLKEELKKNDSSLKIIHYIKLLKKEQSKSVEQSVEKSESSAN